MNLVGLTTDRPSTLDPDGRWFEAIPPVRLDPANLYEAQLRRRLGERSSGADARSLQDKGPTADGRRP